jgi:hypothetical protein
MSIVPSCTTESDCQKKDRNAKCLRGACVCGKPASGNYPDYGPGQQKLYVGIKCESPLHETPLWHKDDEERYPRQAWPGSADLIDYSNYPSKCFGLTRSIVGKVYDQNPFGNCWVYAALGALNAWLCLENNESYEIAPLPFLNAWQNRWPFEYDIDQTRDSKERMYFDSSKNPSLPNVMEGLPIDQAMYIMIQTCSNLPRTSFTFPLNKTGSLDGYRGVPNSFQWKGTSDRVSLNQQGWTDFVNSLDGIKENPPSKFFQGIPENEKSTQKELWENNFSNYPTYLLPNSINATNACSNKGTFATFSREPIIPKGTVVPRFGEGDPWAVTYDNKEIDWGVNLAERLKFYKQMLLQYGPFPISIDGIAIQKPEICDNVVITLDNRESLTVVRNKRSDRLSINHAVLLVGYRKVKLFNPNPNPLYKQYLELLIIKNSWGEDFYYNGFAYIDMTTFNQPFLGLRQAGAFNCLYRRPQFFSAHPTCQTVLNSTFTPDWFTGKIEDDNEIYIAEDCIAGKLETRKVECTNGKCCDPGCTNGSCIGINTCKCKAGWTGPQCDQTQCSLPCQHGGKCIGTNTCGSCEKGWTGHQCEIDQCSSNPCENGGSCSELNTCECTAGWTGAQCQTSQCAGNPCQNGGTCSGVNTCTCPPQDTEWGETYSGFWGYAGAQCQDQVCFSEYRKCTLPEKCAYSGTGTETQEYCE